MKAALRKFEQFKSYPLFTQAGTPVGPEFIQVRNWNVAVAECTTQKWENCRLMARNALQQKMELRSWPRAQEWNPICEKLRPEILSFIDKLKQTAPAPPETIEKIQHDLSWDMLFICMEREFQDTITPFFSLPLLDPIYAGGHLPCGWTGVEFPAGWDGILPEGKLMVF